MVEVLRDKREGLDFVVRYPESGNWLDYYGALRAVLEREPPADVYPLEWNDAETLRAAVHRMAEVVRTLFDGLLRRDPDFTRRMFARHERQSREYNRSLGVEPQEGEQT